MLAGQKSYGNNGYQNFLFPLEIMWITQGDYQYTYSHNGCYAMDFQGAKYEDGHVVRRYHCPYYAPFDCTCVAKWGSSSPMVVWQSDNPVNAIGYGLPIVCCIGFCHDDYLGSIHVGDHKMQGDVIGHTGTYGAAAGADHVHIEAVVGTYDGYYLNSNGVYMLRNSTHLYNLMGVNDTDLYKDYYVNHQGTTVEYNWREFSDIGPTPPQPTPTIRSGHKFPWWLYWRNFRNGIR